MDVSPEGDWTAVKVWYNPINDLGTSVYPTYGFIHKAPALPSDGVLMAAAPTADGQP